MRRVACTAATFVLIATLACRKQQSNAAAGTDAASTASTAASAPTPSMSDTAGTTTDFSFDQRQVFASDRALANIRASRRAVDRSLDRVEAASAANWDQIKQGINHALDNLSESIQAAQPK
jgi:hypothetical protein